MAGLSQYITTCESCIKADVFQDIEDRNILYFIGQWESQEALADIEDFRFMGVLKGIGPLLEKPMQINRLIETEEVKLGAVRCDNGSRLSWQEV